MLVLFHNLPACTGSLYEESSLQNACMTGMGRLEREHQRSGVLDRQTFAQGFGEGAEWVPRRLGTKTYSTEQFP